MFWDDLEVEGTLCPPDTSCIQKLHTIRVKMIKLCFMKTHFDRCRGHLNLHVNKMFFNQFKIKIHHKRSNEVIAFQWFKVFKWINKETITPNSIKWSGAALERLQKVTIIMPQDLLNLRSSEYHLNRCKNWCAITLTLPPISACQKGTSEDAKIWTDYICYYHYMGWGGFLA